MNKIHKNKIANVLGILSILAFITLILSAMPNDYRWLSTKTTDIFVKFSLLSAFVLAVPAICIKWRNALTIIAFGLHIVIVVYGIVRLTSNFHFM